jgi:hypothetical protein
MVPMFGQFDASLYILTSCSHAIRVSLSDATQRSGNSNGPLYPTYNASSSHTEVPPDMRWWCEIILAAG